MCLRSRCDGAGVEGVHPSSKRRRVRLLRKLPKGPQGRAAARRGQRARKTDESSVGDELVQSCARYRPLSDLEKTLKRSRRSERAHSAGTARGWFPLRHHRIPVPGAAATGGARSGTRIRRGLTAGWRPVVLLQRGRRACASAMTSQFSRWSAHASASSSPTRASQPVDWVERSETLDVCMTEPHVGGELGITLIITKQLRLVKCDFVI